MAKMEYKEKNGKYSCPCCGKLTLDKPDFGYICSECGWEDDFGQNENPDLYGGANYISLNDAKKLYAKYGDRIDNHDDEWEGYDKALEAIKRRGEELAKDEEFQAWLKEMTE